MLAAAIVGRANVIVTFNLKDFPAQALNSYDIEAQHPDTFIRHTLDLDPLALAAIRDCRASLKIRPKPWLSSWRPFPNRDYPKRSATWPSGRT